LKKKAEKDPRELASLLIDSQGDRNVTDISIPRASTLYDACIRMHVLAKKYEIKKSEYVNIGNKITFGIGNAVHSHAQNTGFLFGNRRIGIWECVSCKHKTWGVFPKTACKKCGCDDPVYKEYDNVVKSPYTFSFHIDMFLNIEDKIRVVELKTINKDGFDDLLMPLGKHDAQVNMYLLGCSLDLFLKEKVKVDTEMGYILYLSKGSCGKEIPCKAFEVHRNQHMQEAIAEKLYAYMDGINSFPEKLPDLKPLCQSTSFSCYEAKTCPVVDHCKKYGSCEKN
jgi:hypothetical protein